MNSRRELNVLPPFNAYIMIGPVVLGALVNACLFGGLVIQTYVYHANFPNDHRVVKLTTAHVICVSATLWKVAVSGYGNPLTLSVFPLGADAAILFTAITGNTIYMQSCFAFRLWKLSKTLTLPLISLALCLLAQSIALTMTVKAFAMTNLLTFETDENKLITLSLTSRLVCELTLTLSMAWYLRKQRSSAFVRTTTIIDRLVLWTLETGLMTSLVVVLVMSFFLAMKQNYIWVGLYATLATGLLNGRLILRVPNQSLNMNPPSSSAGRRSRETQSLVINVTRTVGTVPDVFKYDEGEV
ncbi:uncharacterized protein F5891DRAFT_999328 [Suillus fuscotomentosus]|uniref:DUF6534 domain-containing protein n=1 Tax=Suillus fuscotomentosus TaxID=1912939 RepID=A0AAD4HSG6_9AGAM|nr:uncharacterized protein F5891DRAFT_999328 [Suillus fuscotomentosus]KAG1906911.1 hypothetical protein F5891DRAFT_999328 [Suillus fuscotomentosus]